MTTNVFLHKVRNLLAENAGDARWLDLEQVVKKDDNSLALYHLLDKSKGSFNTPVYFDVHGEVKPIVSLNSNLMKNSFLYEAESNSNFITVETEDVEGTSEEPAKTVFKVNDILSDFLTYNQQNSTVSILDNLTIDNQGNISSNGKISTNMIPDEMQDNVAELTENIEAVEEDIEVIKEDIEVLDNKVDIMETTAREVYIGTDQPTANNFRIWIQTD